ncbi:hypothetical protein RS130_09250 [Paraglaciecola aquimarina]|uniref:Uncharacterized protein n=1 Tax=Paraglaciecola aquimarina TaxID=1235557 RepID=A0ABU3SVS3_9ALTE|nr:hypothetical protein [Paraglaciecola aquimarina]MDU0354095.1 hypothetical protein [Paraglaciecola aquimarina]
MKITKNNLLNAILFSIIVLSLGLNSYANEAIEEKIFTQEGYPYKMLIDRASQVKLMYKGTDNITCRVEVTYKQQTWVGQEHKTKQKKFATKPLGECMDRDLAKKILKAIF